MIRESLIVRSTPIVQKISSELIALTPEHWNTFFVFVEVTSVPSDLEDLEIIIRSNENYDDIVMPSDDLNSLIFELFDLFKESSRIKSFECKVFHKIDGNGSYETDFVFF